MTNLNQNESLFLLSAHVRKSVRDATDELEVTFLDLDAKSWDDAVITITTKDFTLERRSAQTFEMEKAERIIAEKLKGEWMPPFDS